MKKLYNFTKENKGVKNWVEQNGLIHEEVAKILGLCRVTVTYKLQGRTAFSLSELLTLHKWAKENVDDNVTLDDIVYCKDLDCIL